MELKAKETQLSKPSSDRSKQDQIKIQLAKMAIRRQAKMGETEYAVYAYELLHYDLEDITEALDMIGLTARGEGESALPDVGTILEAIRGVVRARMEPTPTGIEKWAAYVRRVKAERGE